MFLQHLYIPVQPRGLKVQFHILGSMVQFYDLCIKDLCPRFALMPTKLIRCNHYDMLHKDFPYQPRNQHGHSFLSISLRISKRFFYILQRKVQHRIFQSEVYRQYLKAFQLQVQQEDREYPIRPFLKPCNLS